MDGFETTKKIRQLKQDDWFPIVFITSKNDDDSFTKGILAGGDAYLSKPLAPLRLQLQFTAMERIYMMRKKLKQAEAENKIVNEKLLQMAMFDELTGLANRRNFDTTLAREFKLAKRQKNPLSVIICDIDFFKLYNDEYGHQQGDACLAQIARAIGSVLERPTDLACRYGGEEFTLILPHSDIQGGLRVAEKLRQSVWNENVSHCASKIEPRVTLSVGLATYNGQFKTADEITKAADDALYRAKKNGRNRFESA
jgi:diguanylate cyclase (GGDEF)-like protein